MNEIEAIKKRRKLQTIVLRREVLVKNTFNALITEDFTEKDIDIFYGLTYKLAPSPYEPVLINQKDMREIIGFSENVSKSVYLENVDKLLKKLQSTLYVYFSNTGETDRNYTSLFQMAQLKKDSGDVILQANELFRTILNVQKNEGKFFSMDVTETVNLSGKYSKKLYPLLRQWQYVGEITIEKAELLRKLQVDPATPLKKVNARILAPAVIQLQDYFEELEMIKNKIGRTIISYTFLFRAKSNKKGEGELKPKSTQTKNKIQLYKNDIEPNPEFLEMLEQQQNIIKSKEAIMANMVFGVNPPKDVTPENPVLVDGQIKDEQLEKDKFDQEEVKKINDFFDSLKY